MEHLHVSKTRSSLALSLSLALHLLLIFTVLHQSLSQRHELTFMQHEQDAQTYTAQKIISAGQHQPATVLFQDEAPSGDDIIASAQHEEAQVAQETEQHTESKTQAPLDEPQEEAKTTTFETFAKPMPTHQTPEVPAAVPVPQQQQAPAAQRRTANKKAVTMADISRGFIKSVQQEAGHNSASRDMKQLALQIYATKIWNIIKNAFLVGDNGLHLTEDVSTHTQLILTIDRTGKLLNIHLDYPKHIAAVRNIERLIVSRAHQAGLFPPLPAQIPGTSKTFSFPLFIEGQKGFHAYSLGYQ